MRLTKHDLIYCARDSSKPFSFSWLNFTRIYKTNVSNISYVQYPKHNILYKIFLDETIFYLGSIYLIAFIKM